MVKILDTTVVGVHVHLSEMYDVLNYSSLQLFSLAKIIISVTENLNGAGC